MKILETYMLKKIALAAVLAAGSSVAMADPDVGCGVGSQVWAGQSGCNGNGKVTAQVVTFTNENSESLARDMAVGQGESLTVLASLLNVKDADKAHFYAVAKSNFANIYSVENQNSLQVLASLQQVMANDAVLKAYV
ncbi:hypothetical protein FQR65_LT17140 [Abscondita terminalis]|nr:hypothetical protein FQR65_LT17140 [Abscondita terminalis]